MRNQVAIEVKEGVSVIVTFLKNNVTRMTRQGMQNTSDIACYLYQSGSMEFLGGGVAVRAPEDAENDDLGMELAFSRAVKSAFPYDKEARTTLHQVYRDAKNKIAPVKQPKPVAVPQGFTGQGFAGQTPQAKLIIPFEDLFRVPFESDDEDDDDDYNYNGCDCSWCVGF